MTPEKDSKPMQDRLSFPQTSVRVGAGLLALTLALGASPALAQSEAEAPAETESSSVAAPLPGEGGGLPRAAMPEGGVDDGSQEALRTEPEPPPPPPPVETPPPVEPPPPADDKTVVEPKPEPKAEPPANAADNFGPTAQEPRGLGSSFGTNADEDLVGGIQIRWNGYVRLAAEVVENDSNSEFIGRNDGFKLANARLGMQARKGDFSAYVSFEAAVGDRETFNDPNAEFAVRLRDAYMRYEVAKFARVTAGRFKTPYDLSSLESTALRTFVEQPVESRGVLPTQGFEVRGLETDRQLGVMVHRDKLGLDLAGFDFGYALALTNGFAPGNLAFNDNDRPAVFGRLSAYWSDYVALNLAGFSDTRTVGDLPDLFDEDVKGLEVSLLVGYAGLRLEGQFLYQNTQFETSGRPDVNSLGGHAQFAYDLWDFTLAYRWSFFDPNTSDIEDADRVQEHTLGLAYQVKTLPLRFMLNGTVAQEQAGRKLSNNRAILLAQYIF